MNTGERCENCRFWKEGVSYPGGDPVFAKGSFGACRRHAPRGPITTDPRDLNLAYIKFPMTELDDWCGEHHPLQSSPEAA